jgi:hypothetical protein
LSEDARLFSSKNGGDEMRRRSTAGLFVAIAADLARQQRQAEAARIRLEREAERRIKAEQRAALQSERQHIRNAKELERQQKLYALTRGEHGAADLNAEINSKFASLKSILPDALANRNSVSFENLRVHDAAPPFLAPANLKEPKTSPDETSYYSAVERPRGIKSLLPGNKRRYDSLWRKRSRLFNLP